MLNRIQLMGNLGHDPEIRITQKGREAVTFSLATHNSWKDPHGEWQKKTEWHRVTVYREPVVTKIKGNLKKGDYVFVEGRLSYSEWEDPYTQQKQRVAHIMISSREGQVEYLRSGKLAFEQELRMSEDSSVGQTWGKELEERERAPFLEDDSRVYMTGTIPAFMKAVPSTVPCVLRGCDIPSSRVPRLREDEDKIREKENILQNSSLDVSNGDSQTTSFSGYEPEGLSITIGENSNEK